MGRVRPPVPCLRRRRVHDRCGAAARAHAPKAARPTCVSIVHQSSERRTVWAFFCGKVYPFSGWCLVRLLTVWGSGEVANGVTGQVLWGGSCEMAPLTCLCDSVQMFCLLCFVVCLWGSCSCIRSFGTFRRGDHADHTRGAGGAGGAQGRRVARDAAGAALPRRGACTNDRECRMLCSTTVVFAMPDLWLTCVFMCGRRGFFGGLCTCIIVRGKLWVEKCR